MCSVLNGNINTSIEGTKICDSDANHNCLDIGEGHTSDIVIANGHHTDVVSISNHGNYTVISTAAGNIDLLEIFIDRMC